MNCRGLLVLVVALIALNQGVITPPMQVAGVVMALVTTMMTGPLVDRFVPKGGRGVPVVGPPTTDTTRILAVVGTVDEAAPVADIAYRLAGSGPAEVILFRPIPLSPYDELPAGLHDEVLEAESSLRALKLLGTLAPDGVTVQPTTYGAVDPAGAALDLADQGVDLIVVATTRLLAVGPRRPPRGVGALSGRRLSRGHQPPAGRASGPARVGPSRGGRRRASRRRRRRQPGARCRHGRRACLVVVGAADSHLAEGLITSRTTVVLTVHPPADSVVRSAATKETS